MTVSVQREFVRESFRRLAAQQQFVFLMLMLERLLAICTKTFPDGLPTKSVSYERVTEAVEALWTRLEVTDARESVARLAESWRPLTSTGHVEHKPGAALGFHVADLISRLARVDVRHQIDGTLDVAWEAVQSVLFRLPEHPDYSQSFVDTDLDPGLNGALLLEYETQRTAIAALNATAEVEVGDLRQVSQAVAFTIAEREREYLEAS
jgi:hypothetical protein